tara:strand:+ start:3754 stop:3996 length:243 start_codon:yes stop_codon:yes gene_type:complete
MKLAMTIGRKGDKFKTLYLGQSTSEALDASDKETQKARPSFDEVMVLKNPAHYRRRKIMAGAPEVMAGAPKAVEKSGSDD